MTKVKIKQFKNKAKEPVAGLTPEHAIYDKNGVRLDAKLGSWNLSNIRDAQTESVRAVLEAAKQYDHQTVINNGTITNVADEEDITVRDNVLSLKDRTYIEGVNEMGYIILRKNKSFAEQVTKQNTIYEIRYEFDLNGEKVTIPEGCVLKFVGGAIINGTLNCNNCAFTGIVKFTNMYFEGDIKNDYISPEWFGLSKSREDNEVCINAALSMSGAKCPVILPPGTFKCKGAIVLSKSEIILKGVKGQTVLNYPKNVESVKISKNVSNLIVADLCFQADGSSWDTLGTENTAKCITLDNGTHYSSFSGIKIDNYNIGIDLQYNCYCNSIKDTSITNCNIGITWINESNWVTIEKNSFLNNIECIRANHGVGTFINDCLFEGNSIGVSTGNSFNGTISNCYFEGNRRHDIEIQYINAHCKRISISNNNFQLLTNSRESDSDSFILVDGLPNDTKVFIKSNVFNIVGDTESIFYVSKPKNTSRLIPVILENNTLRTNNIELYSSISNVLSIDNTNIKSESIVLSYPSNSSVIDVTDLIAQGYTSFSLWVSKEDTKIIVPNKNVYPFGIIKPLTFLISTNDKVVKIERTDTLLENLMPSNKSTSITLLPFQQTPTNFSYTRVVSNNSQIPDVLVSGLELNNTGSPRFIAWDKNLGREVYYNGKNAYTTNGYLANKIYGSTEERPTDSLQSQYFQYLNDGNKGYYYFDTTLNKPIWWNGTKWVDATGADV